jgi:putative heme-binding domain-containing protein
MSWVIALLCAAAQDLVARTDPLTPDQERARFHVPPGFEVQLVAAEPDIQKPLNLAFDARGRLWVTGSVEYPFPAPAGRGGRDTVKILEDFGPDGRARKVTTFADDLNIPIGLLPTADGALVFSIPNLWRMIDADGDGRADRRDALFGPFETRDTHGMTSAFRLGLDGWVYACHGYANTNTLRAADGSTLTMNSGNVYRFRPDGARVESFTLGQVNPFGLAFDPRGDLYSADCHTRPAMMLLRGACYDSFGKPHDGMGYAPEICFHDHGSTAIAGIVHYAADYFPAEYRDTLFIGNPVTSRINHDRLARAGSSPTCVLQPDFLVSDDPWFRPVDLRLGPDGAIYVADFYNRIIGHYEVPLNHPGRDRERGRIWRIVRKDAAPAPPRADWTRASVEHLVSDLGHSNLEVRTIATHELVRRGAAVVEPVRALFGAVSSPTQRAHALWVLERLGAPDGPTLSAAARDADPLVRVHAMRVLSEQAKISAPDRERLLGGLRDPDAFVRRAAADALSRHPAAKNVAPLLDLLRAVEPGDAQLRHAARLALRESLRTPEAWPELSVEGPDASTVADVALGLKTAEAAQFLIRYLCAREESLENRSRYVHHAARFAAPDAMRRLIARAPLWFADSPRHQIEILTALRRAAEERGVEPDPAVRRWAGDVVTRMVLRLSDESQGWTALELDGTPAAENPWSVQTRPDADGNAATPVISSFPSGETRTGLLRSPAFDIPARLSFFVAGHNGPPDRPDHRKNRVALRAADTNEVLAEVGPPRNDTAQKIVWDLARHGGRKGYLEVRDGDDAGAYAWIAVGRIDGARVVLPEWEPASRPWLLAAIEMAVAMKADGVEGKLRTLANLTDVGGEIRGAAFRALARMNPEAYVPTMMSIVGSPDQPEELRAAVSLALVELNRPDTRKAVVELLASAPARLERATALALASSRAGGDALLEAVSQGKASPRLLQDRAVADRLEAAKIPRLKARIDELTAGLPSADEQAQRLIERRRAGFDGAPADWVRGERVFEKLCAACHQIGGKGARLAPQLDGVGLRGVERILEDILDPNRNIDPAFRTIYFTLEDESIVMGVVAREEGEVIVVAQGKDEFRVPKRSVVKREARPVSPMPTNLADLATEAEFYDLMAYLLTQRAQPPK